MIRTGRAYGWHGRRGAALAAFLALAVAVTLVWITGDRSPATAPAAAGGSTGPASPTAPSAPGSARSTDPQSGGGSAGGAAVPAGLHLRAGSATKPAQPIAVVPGQPLDEEQVAAVEKRLPAQAPGTGGAQPFRWPIQTLSVPQAGRTVPIPFPAQVPTVPVPPASTPPALHVLRVQPQGPVSLAPFLSITFDQPMVPLATVGQLAAAQPPAVISPKLAGSWQWIGTSTARFVASGRLDRLPMATVFTVAVPAGTRDAAGSTLARAATFSFSTPAPTVKHFEPTGKSMRRDPLFVAVFDQQVDPAAVLGKVRATAGTSSVPLRQATTAEIAADARASSTVATAPAGRVVVFRPVDALAADQAVTVTFGAGLPSAEGPRTTTKETSFTGRTYAALAIRQAGCGGGSCQPSSPLIVTFNNALDAKSFDPAAVRVDPAIPGGATITASGTAVVVEGATQADTEYTVTLPATLTDVFGQKLGSVQVRAIRIGPATQRLDPFPQPVTTLDPMAGAPSITVNTVNRKEFRERVFAVSPSDWPAFQRFYLQTMQKDYSSGSTLVVPDWRVLADTVVPISGPASRLVSTRIDLSGVLPGPGAVVVLVEPTSRESFGNDTWQNRPTMTWAQSTTLGVDAFNDATQLRAWVTDLRTGAPVAGVTVGLLGSDGQVDPQRADATDADGIASLALSATGASALLATRGGESALLPSTMWGNGWTRAASRDRLLWFVNDDRHTYRPGETVSIKGWVRRQSAGVVTALSLPPAGTTVSYTARDEYGVVLGHGVTKLSALGGFDLTLTIPGGANLGSASINFRLADLPGVDSTSDVHAFDIADFRTPDFEVDAHAESSGPFVLGDEVTVAADATYYAGGPLAAAPVDWQVRTAVATYAPPGWNAFTFGIWTPWWQVGDAGFDSGYGGFDPGYGGIDSGYAGSPIGDGGWGSTSPDLPDTESVQKFSGTTGADGSHYLQVKVGDLGKKYAGLPVTVTSQATVTDVNRQAIAGTADLLVHPADFYVGLAAADTFVSQGKDLAVQAVATDIDGAAAPGRAISMKAAKVTTSWVNGTSTETESDPQTCAVTSAAGPVTCTFRPSTAGTYRITATITDDKGRTSRSQLTRWIAGPDGAVDSSVQRQLLTLVPDKKDYQPGTSARLLVQSPIRSGSGLLTVLHNGIAATIRFAVADGSAVVSVPITDAELPGITASVEVVGTTPRAAAGASPRPAYATGEIALTVSTQVRTLKVTAVPRQKTVAPGGSTSVDVTVSDQQGKPLPHSEFELAVVDEAVLALGGVRLPDPMAAFFPEQPGRLTAFFGRSTVLLADQPPPPNQQSGAPSSAAASSAAPAAGSSTTEFGLSADSAARSTASGSAPAIAERRNFDALAVFVPSAVTDGNGRATVRVPLPDNLTRYRVMVVAVSGTSQFGSAESTITAGLPLTVRPSAPRFLNFGDKLTLPVLVQNQTDAPLTTDVVVQATNLTIPGTAGRRVTVPAHGRIQVPFAISAAQAGTAELRVAAVSGSDADAATVEIPVYTPTTTETFASYGVLTSGSILRQPVTAPRGVVPQFGGLQISTSSTALQQLTDAVGYLADYQYDSSDALASQIVAIGSLGDVLAAFDAPGLPSAATLKALVTSDVQKLTGLQNDDGGFPYWQRGERSDPFNSIQATQALQVAARHGFSVPQNILSNADRYLTNINAYLPRTTSQTARDTVRAYALNVRMQGGHRNAAGGEALVRERGAALPLDAVAWLLPVVADPAAREALLRRIGNAAVDDAGSVTFTNKVTDDAWTTLQSDRRTDGLILDALVSVQPTSDLIPKIVSGLIGGQTSGRWSNVQENAFILLALRHYYDAFENASPDFVAQVWLGNRFAGQHAFRGHTSERATVALPTGQLLAAGNSDVTLRNDGTGRLYYRLALQTAPSDLKLTPLDRGFVVSRTYQAVDHPGDVTRDAAGVWHIKAGARVRVNLDLVSRSARTHVALIDPIPAGLQILNPELATTPRDLGPTAVPAAGSPAVQSWFATWYDHQNLRDDRAEAFASQLQGGVYRYSYLAGATTTGSFVAPPPRAEQVYAPETFGRGGSDRVVIGS